VVLLLIDLVLRIHRDIVNSDSVGQVNLGDQGALVKSLSRRPRLSLKQRIDFFTNETLRIIDLAP
jgi:hypothetical protein